MAANTCAQPLELSNPWTMPRPGRGRSNPEQAHAVYLMIKERTLADRGASSRFFSGVFQVKSKELKKINNSNKKEARKRCPKSGKSENENRKEKEALSMGQGVGKGGAEAWEEGCGTTKENKMCHAK